MVLGVANRSNATLKIRWDEHDDSIAEPTTSTIQPTGEGKFDLDKFGSISTEVIQSLARIVELDTSKFPHSGTPKSTPRNSTRTTPQSSSTGLLPSSTSEQISDRHLARKFAAQHIQSAGLRTIMMIFSTCQIEEITKNSAIRTVLAELISQSAKPSSLEVGVPLGDLIRAGNVMLSSAIGSSSPWEASATFSDDSLNTSDEEMTDDEDDDEFLTDTEVADDESGLPPVLRALINQVNEANAAAANQVATQQTASVAPNQNGNPVGNPRQGIGEIERVVNQEYHRIRTRSTPNSDPNSTPQAPPPNYSIIGQTAPTMPPRQLQSTTNPAGNPPTETGFRTSPPFGPPPPPPPPPPITALAEMGFTLPHIQQGIRALNLNPTTINATQIAVLGKN